MKKIIITILLTIFALNTYAMKDIPQIDQKDKMIVLFVKTKNCQWCKKMDKESFKNRDSLDKITKLYRIKKVIKGDQLLPSFINPKYYPTTYILSSDGKKLIDELPGYMKNRDFVSYLEELYNVEMNLEQEEE